MNEDNIETAPNVPPFVRYVASTIPMVFDNSLSYYEALGALAKSLQDTVDVVNNNGTVTEEYIQFTKDMKEYMDHYFDNLDVQAEINNKLDQMAASGELGELIGAYVLPIQQAYEARVDAKINQQDNAISVINTKVEAATSGSPIPVSDISDMTDEDRIYVLVSTGKWYYYDGDSWEIGGDYQTPVADFDPTLTVADGIPDSKAVGDRINSNFYVNNIVDVNNIQANKTYNSSGEIISNTGSMLFNDVIQMKSGDTIYCQYNNSGSVGAKSIALAVEVDAYGNFVSYIGAIGSPRYTANADKFIRIVVNMMEDQTVSNVFVFKNIPSSDYLNTNYINKNSEDIKAINKDIDNNSIQYNYLDKTKCILNQNIMGTGEITYTNNTYFITNPIAVKNGDVVRFYNFNTGSSIYAFQVISYNAQGQFIGRTSVTANTVTASADGYLIFNCVKPSSLSDLSNLDISINRELNQHYAYGRIFSATEDKKVRIIKQNSNTFTIYYGNFNVTLFKTENISTNANNWNLKDVKRGENVLVPTGTDIIGPVRINDNTDFIGGVHGDETTNHIIIDIDGTTYKDSNIQNITDIKCDKITITLISSVYDQIAGDLAFTRNVVIDITDNKIHCSNSFKAQKNLTLRTACTGGLIACRNTIINNIVMNNSYYDSAPTTQVNNHNKANTYAVINTIYGSITAINIKGYDNPHYYGFLNVYENESPIRCKVYFEPYYDGTYTINTNDIITGEFEYLFN